MSDASHLSKLALLQRKFENDPQGLEQFINSLSEGEAISLLYDLEFTGRPSQQIPPGDWNTWLYMGGRGIGKTFTGSKTVNKWAYDDPKANIALVAETVADVRDVMILGPSGIIAQARPDFMPVYEPSKRVLTWPNGAQAHTYSADEPDQLRGPNFSKAWVDELAKYQYQQEVWDNLQMCMRLGNNPQVLVTTTPKPTKLIKALVKDPTTHLTTGSTFENYMLPKAYIDNLRRKYEGTRLGQQELHAKILDDNPNGLFKQPLIDNNRLERLTANDVPLWKTMDRIVIAVDPSTTSNGNSDECGIVVAGRKGDHGYVFDDLSGVMSPNEWAHKAVNGYQTYKCDRLVAERNQGGDMVETTIRNVNKFIAYTGVHAKQGKALRAEPISALYEQNRIHHVGYFDTLEQQMVEFDPNNVRANGSPDRLDALVYALTELFGSELNEPRAYFL